MAITVVWASPNVDGLTATTKNRGVEGIEGTGGKADLVHLNRLNIKRRLGCKNGWGNCRSQGACVIPDGFGGLYERLRAADGIIWITPVYWHDLAECLKTFLDRLRRCETAHNHHLRGKECLLVACAGGTSQGAIPCPNRLEDTLSHMERAAVARLPVIRFNKDRMLPALSEAGRTFAAYLAAKRNEASL